MPQSGEAWLINLLPGGMKTWPNIWLPVRLVFQTSKELLLSPLLHGHPRRRLLKRCSNGTWEQRGDAEHSS